MWWCTWSFLNFVKYNAFFYIIWGSCGDGYMSPLTVNQIRFNDENTFNYKNMTYVSYNHQEHSRDVINIFESKSSWCANQRRKKLYLTYHKIQTENMKYCMCEFLFNLLIPKDDQHLISLYNITTVSNIKVKRIKEMITSQRSSWLFNKFSLSAPWKMYREHYGEWRIFTMKSRWKRLMCFPYT